MLAPVGVDEEEGDFLGIIEAQFAKVDAEGSVWVHERPVAAEHLRDFGLEFEHLGGSHGMPGIFLVLGEGGIEENQCVVEAGWDSVLIQIHDGVFYKEMGNGQERVEAPRCYMRAFVFAGARARNKV